MKNSLLSIYILDILNKYADEKHPLTQEQIMEKLSEPEYADKVTRNTISAYISDLRDKGYIAGKRGIYKVKDFSDMELRLLIDGVLYGQSIPKAEAEQLIAKLKNLSGNTLTDRIKNVSYLQNMIRTQNQNLYNTLDILDDAIQNNKKVKMSRCVFDENKKLVAKDREYTVSPYHIVTSKSMYYLICYVDAEGSAYHGKDLENWRLDRIDSVKMINEKRVPLTEVPGYEGNKFKLDKYMKEHIYMWSGENVDVEMRIKKDNIGDLIDWYGTDFEVVKSGKVEKLNVVKTMKAETSDDSILVRFRVNKNAIKFWALQYGMVATIEKPVGLKDEIKELLVKMMQNYGDEGV